LEEVKKTPFPTDSPRYQLDEHGQYYSSQINQMGPMVVKMNVATGEHAEFCWMEKPLVKFFRIIHSTQMNLKLLVTTDGNRFIDALPKGISTW
jgi:hypothetical protein